MSYIDRLRSLDILASYFFPNLLGILRLDEGITKAFKLDIWSVDQFYVDRQFVYDSFRDGRLTSPSDYESGSSFSIPVLAAHLYYRALITLPSLINNWVLDCRDRQLSSCIITYTSQHFAPVIIQNELAHVKQSKDMGELVDSNFTIKVAASVNEVVASYLVDDHHLEIKMKIPADWPLHKIEVKDVKRVGVDENLWRAWLLAVQQTIWSHVCVRYFLRSGVAQVRPHLIEWEDYRWVGFVQEECNAAFRGAGRVCHLLLVSIFLCFGPLVNEVNALV